MNTNPLGDNSYSALNAGNLAALLVRRMNEVLNGDQVQVFHFGGDPYLTDAVKETYQRLADAATNGTDEGEEIEVGLTLPEGGRLLQLCIEGAMSHARDAHLGEPWFTCTTGLDVVHLGAKVFLGLVAEAAKQ